MKFTKSQLIAIILVIVIIIILILCRTRKHSHIICSSDGDCPDTLICQNGVCVEGSNCPIVCPTTPCSCPLDLADTVYQPIVDFSNWIWDCEVQSTGKLVATPANKRLGRWNEDGTPDTTFGIGGLVTFDLEPIADASGLENLFLGPDDSIYAVMSYAPLYSDPSTQVLLVKFTPDGVIDTAFGFNGILVGPEPGMSATSGIVGSDGSIYVNIDDGVLKYNSAGIIDLTYGVNGYGGVADVVFPMLQLDSYEIGVTSSGEVLFGGYAAYGSIFSLASVRLTPDGNPDTSYGLNGICVVPYSAFGPGAEVCDDIFSYGCTFGSDGSVYLTGYVRSDILSPPGTCNDFPFTIVKITPEGQIDTTWATNGVFTFMDPGIGAGAAYDSWNHLVFDSCTGGLVCAFNSSGSGFSGLDIPIFLRLTPEGQIDPSTPVRFGEPEQYVWSMAQSPKNGNIFVCGEDEAANTFKIWEYTCDIRV